MTTATIAEVSTTRFITCRSLADDVIHLFLAHGALGRLDVVFFTKFGHPLMRRRDPASLLLVGQLVLVELAPDGQAHGVGQAETTPARELAHRLFGFGVLDVERHGFLSFPGFSLPDGCGLRQ